MACNYVNMLAFGMRIPVLSPDKAFQYDKENETWNIYDLGAADTGKMDLYSIVTFGLKRRSKRWQVNYLKNMIDNSLKVNFRAFMVMDPDSIGEAHTETRL